MRILKIPSSCGALGKKEGQEQAPDAIAERMKSFHLKETGLLPVLDCSEVAVDQQDIQTTNDAIEAAVSKADAPLLLLGGDHSITYSAFKAFSKKHPGAGLVIFDAHPDCQDDFSPPTHEDYVRVLIEEGHLKKENLLFVALRSMHALEHDYIRKNKIKVFSMREISQDGAAEVCDAVMAAARLFPSFYLSVDIDAADPAFAPGTGYCEPGGLTSRELIYFIQRLRLLKNLQMADIVEVNPIRDPDGLTVSLAARLAIELI